MKKIQVLDTPMHVSTLSETVDTIAERVASHTFTQHVVVNVAKVVNMKNDSELRNSVESCDIINIDGMGLVFGARILGYDIPERVAGIDLFTRLLEMSASKGFKVFLLGAEDSVVQKVKNRAMKDFPGLDIVGTHHGYFWDDEASVVEKIQKSQAQLLFVAITSPKKENFINRWRSELGVDFVMGVGGTFDVVAGKVKRAPIWMQNAGLEWAFRVYQEPGRMWKRYLRTNSYFCWMVLKAKLGLKPTASNRS